MSQGRLIVGLAVTILVLLLLATAMTANIMSTRTHPICGSL